jgi:LacI family transcriptional regulator
MGRRSSVTTTISDVARECGVSTMTVSRVINGNQHVSADMAERVQAAIAKLNYQPNEAARILRGQSSRTIGLLLPNLADTFFSQCAHAVQQRAAQNGYTTMIFACEGDRESEAEELSIMRSRNIAGIILVPSNRKLIPQLRQMRNAGVPIVMMDRTITGLEAGEVLVENTAGAIMAVKHLIGHGHRSILCVGYDSEYDSIASRIDGYRQAMQDAGLEPDLLVVDKGTGVGPQLLTRLGAPNAPTALFTLNNVTSTEVLRALQAETYAVPGRIAIIGFDDFDLAPFLAVPLTAVRQPASQLGDCAAQMLLESLEEGRPNSTSRVVLPTTLIIRNSCGCNSTER